jgi:hypothetical protein
MENDLVEKLNGVKSLFSNRITLFGVIGEGSLWRN